MAKNNEKIKNKSNESTIAYKILAEPWITEAATRLAEMNKYVFKVDLKASKSQIKKSIEELYKVTVLSVRIINIPGKTRNRGQVKGWKAGFKKAIITVKEGENIDIFEKK